MFSGRYNNSASNVKQPETRAYTLTPNGVPCLQIIIFLRLVSSYMWAPWQFPSLKKYFLSLKIMFKIKPDESVSQNYLKFWAQLLQYPIKIPAFICFPWRPTASTVSPILM